MQTPPPAAKSGLDPKVIGSELQTFFASFNTLADLNPGNSVETAVVFDVPVGTDPESIELHDGPFSDGVTVGL
jgi:hypothetical protein